MAKKTLPKTILTDKNDIKQPQGGSPAENFAVNPDFKGYDHSLSKEEKQRLEFRSKVFWESRGLKY